MKITKLDLQQIIKEEALRLFKIQKLEEAKSKINEELNLLSEGKKNLSEEEMIEMMKNLKSLLK